MKNNQNPWLLVSGILTILTAVGYGIVMLISIIAVANAEGVAQGGTPEDVEAVRIVMTSLLVFSIIAIGCSIFSAVIYFKYSKLSFEEIKKGQGLAITTVVLTFISGNLLAGIFGIVGICVKPEDNAANQNNTILTGKMSSDEKNVNMGNITKELDKLTTLKDKGMITEEEYVGLRAKLIERYLQD